MKFGIASHEGCSLWLAARLQDEGEEVLMYHFPPINKPFADAEFKKTGDGIVPLAKTWREFEHAECDVVIFDGTDWGRKGDDLRERGIPVINGSPVYDRLEKERDYAMKVAQSCGMVLPVYHEFGSISASMEFVRSRPADEHWFFKSNRELGAALTASGDRKRLLARLSYIQRCKGDRIKHILQEKIEGVALSTLGYWNGATFLRPWEGTLERKEFGNDDTGPKTGCCMNLLWFYPNETRVVSELHFDKLAEYLRKMHAPPAIIDINALLSKKDGKAYFLEFTPRYGFDAEPTAARLQQGSYAEMLARLAEGTLSLVPFSLDAAALGIRLSVPPYPFEDGECEIGLPLLGLDGLWGERPSDYFMAYGVMEADGEYQLSDPHGLVGVATTTGVDLEEMNERCVRYARKLGIADLGYRTDAGKRLLEDAEAVRKAGYPAPLLGRKSEAA